MVAHTIREPHESKETTLGTLRKRFAAIFTSKGSDCRDSFWQVAHIVSGLSERQRLDLIRDGFDITFLVATREAFGVSKTIAAEIACISTVTYDRMAKNKRPLGQAASERLDRLAQVAVIAEEVFEDKELATKWMSTPNRSLGDEPPLALCGTELGARQVRRVLHAIEWGGVA